MNKEELIKWFDEKMMNCYHYINDDNNIFWCYDPVYIRKKKLDILLNKEVNIPPYDENKVIFHQDRKNKDFWCDYNNIWSFLYDNYSYNYKDVHSFIKDRLLVMSNLKQYTHIAGCCRWLFWLLEMSNLKQYTPLRNINFVNKSVGIDVKFKAIYTKAN